MIIDVGSTGDAAGFGFAQAAVTSLQD